MNRLEELLLKLLRHWLPYYVLAWVAAVGASAIALQYAWHSFDSDRQDGNSGHATIDFGGQYLMGRMLVTGHGHDLYNRNVQRPVLRAVYPDENSRPVKPPPDPKAARAAGSLLLPLGAADPLSASVAVAAGEDDVWTEERLDRLDSAFQAQTAWEKLDKERKSDSENLMYWTMGNDDPDQAKAAGAFLLPFWASDPLSASVVVAACEDDVWTPERLDTIRKPKVGGPLYPPVNAFVAAPLALMPPPLAYRVQQVFNLILAFLAAAGARHLARGRVWWPVLVPAILMFPGYAGSINLGQNATLTLTIVVWGWALAARGRPVLGGMVWGLLAFKPVWALAFFLVPLLSRRWRMGLAMVATGAALGLLTLPFVGLHSWFDWLSIGKDAAETYDWERNWIFLSRDLLSVPRRWWIDFEQPWWERMKGDLWVFHPWGDIYIRIPVWLANWLVGWALLLFVLENTVRLAVMRWRRAAPPDGPPAAYLFLGAWMCCYHFMYYDALLGSLGLFLLFTEPRRFLSPLLVALGPLRNESAGPAVVAYHRPALPPGLPPPALTDVTPRAVWTLNRLAPTAWALLLLIHYLFPVLNWGSHWGTPWDTFTLAGVWAWCGWQWLRHGEKVAASWDEGQPAERPIDVVRVGEAERNGESAPDAAKISAALPGDAS